MKLFCIKKNLKMIILWREYWSEGLCHEMEFCNFLDVAGHFWVQKITSASFSRTNHRKKYKVYLQNPFRNELKAFLGDKVT